MEITLLLNNPPGGRCRLYQAYGAALAEHAAARCDEQFGRLPQQSELRAPAILINGQAVAPADGVIISPQDLGRVLDEFHPGAPRLEMLLDEVLERCMAEWS
ncbi:MAG: hypothetical protein AB1450_07580 [Pseudomonadota bacterium]